MSFLTAKKKSGRNLGFRGPQGLPGNGPFDSPQGLLISGIEGGIGTPGPTCACYFDADISDVKATGANHNDHITYQPPFFKKTSSSDIEIISKISFDNIPVFDDLDTASLELGGYKLYRQPSDPRLRLTNQQTVLFTEDFESMSSLNFQIGPVSDAQYLSGKAINYAASLSGWSRSGGNAIHVVDNNNNGNQTRTNPTEFGVMIWAGNANIITQNSTIANSNINGVEYRVDFNISPCVYRIASQVTNGSDYLIIRLLTSSNSIKHSYSTINPGAWAGVMNYQPDSFTYTGDGTGNLKFQIRPGFVVSRFQGAVNHLKLTSIGV